MHEVAKVLEFQLQHHSFQRNPRADLLQNGLVGSPCSPRDSVLPHHSSKASILQCSAFFTVQLSHPYMTTGKTIALTILYNIFPISRLSKCLLIFSSTIFILILNICSIWNLFSIRNEIGLSFPPPKFN